MSVNLLLKITVIILLILPITGFTQVTIKGVVTDESNESIIGASVLIKGTITGTITDIDGSFSLESRDSMPLLVISYAGYATQEIAVSDPTKVKVQLYEGSELSEVVVTGLGVRTEKKAMGYGVSTISSSSIRTSSSEGSSRKSKSSKIKIRGKSSIPAMIDGVPLSKEIKGVEKIKTEADASLDLKAGTLTAGELNDFKKWDMWQDVTKEDLEEWQTHWQFKPIERYTVQLTNENGFPVVDATVQLLDKNKQTIFQTHSDNTGKAELWSGLYSTNTLQEKNYQIKVVKNGEGFYIKKIMPFHQGINALQLPVSCANPKNLDIMMVVDATGSMSDEISYLKTELADVINQTQKTHQSLNINLGSVFYRDQGEEYLTKKSVFSSDISKTITFIKNQNAGGGGDTPEAVESALSVAIDSMSWSKQAVARILFLVLDAPPHHNPKIIKQIHDLSTKAAKKGIKIIPITGSGIGKSTEYLMRCLSLTTNGTYVFLTDHSGIGGSHIEPTTDSYDVELLNALMIRLIDQYAKVLNCAAPIALVQKKDISPLKRDQKKLEKELKLKLYPNPTTGPITIEAKKEIKELLITDVTGKILERRQNWKKGKHRIDLVQYPSGIYFFQFKTKNGLLSKKIIVQHPSFSNSH